MDSASPTDNTAREKQEAFAAKLLSDTSAAMTTLLASVGDRLGLFKDLATNGPATSAELATRSGINERYAREWLGGMTTAGYLDYDPRSNRFMLPPEHAPALAEESGPLFFGGFHEMVTAMTLVADRVIESFRYGDGVPQSAYPEQFWEGAERATAVWFENFLVQQWLAAIPDARAKLDRGALVADVGCGRGRALIKLAQAFPESRYVGFDVFEPMIDQATRNAVAAGVGDRVRFEMRDASKGLPEKFDVITTFDVVHDSVHPVKLLESIRAGLKDDGIYICLDVNCSDKLEENIGPIGAMAHAFSVMYCLTTSLANGGAGLGALGFHEQEVNRMCKEAGFRTVVRVPIENPFNNLYEVRP